MQTLEENVNVKETEVEETSTEKTYTQEEVLKLIQAEADRRTNQALKTQAKKYRQTSPAGNIKKSKACSKYQSFFGITNFSSNKNFLIPGLDTNMIPQGILKA